MQNLVESDTKNPVAELTLSDLAQRIIAEHHQAEADVLSAVQHALNAGRMLVEAKSRIKHGGWGKWVRETFPKWKPRTERLYRWLANHWGEITAKWQATASLNGDAPLTIDAAIKLLSAPDEEPDDDCGGVAVVIDAHPLATSSPNGATGGRQVVAGRLSTEPPVERVVPIKPSAKHRDDFAKLESLHGALIREVDRLNSTVGGPADLVKQYRAHLQDAFSTMRKWKRVPKHKMNGKH